VDLDAVGALEPDPLRPRLDIDGFDLADADVIMFADRDVGGPQPEGLLPGLDVVIIALELGH